MNYIEGMWGGGGGRPLIVIVLVAFGWLYQAATWRTFLAATRSE